jgi:hypothetical protein
MYVPPEITSRIEKLSERLRCKLSVVQCWINEFRPGMYCRFRGVLHDSSVIKIEVAGTISVELTPTREDELDLFLFVNGRRVGLYKQGFKYLCGRANGDLRWDDTDEGYEGFDTLDENYGNGGHVHADIAIPEPKFDGS